MLLGTVMSPAEVAKDTMITQSRQHKFFRQTSIRKQHDVDCTYMQSIRIDSVEQHSKLQSCIQASQHGHAVLVYTDVLLLTAMLHSTGMQQANDHHIGMLPIDRFTTH